MDNLKYVHAADLHLDTAFIGLGRAGNEQLADTLSQSTFTALANLASLCEAERPDFLLLAGDIYNQEDHSVRAQLRLCKMAIALEELGIPIYISYGNHDPLSSRLAAIHYPDNVKEFGSEPEIAQVKKGDETIAQVHGASHASNLESRNIAQLFQRDPGFDGFQIGLLHCNADGAVKNDRYAPCSVRDLVDSGLDAWALGHAHKRQILSDLPFIAYSGCTQGIRATECGPQGCLVVNACKNGNGWRCDVLFRQLGPIVWMKGEINLAGVTTLNDAADRIQTLIQDFLADTEFCEGLIAGLSFSGRTELAASLARPGACEELLQEAVSGLAENFPIWPGELINNTRPPDQISILDRDDLLGEIGRLGQKYAADPDALKAAIAAAIQPLYGNRRFGAHLEQPDGEAMNALLQKAQLLCQDLLEGR